jgi:hypothetical protein
MMAFANNLWLTKQSEAAPEPSGCRPRQAVKNKIGFSIPSDDGGLFFYQRVAFSFVTNRPS